LKRAFGGGKPDVVCVGIKFKSIVILSGSPFKTRLAQYPDAYNLLSILIWINLNIKLAYGMTSDRATL
jgi:hypothetical protein